MRLRTNITCMNTDTMSLELTTSVASRIENGGPAQEFGNNVTTDYKDSDSDEIDESQGLLGDHDDDDDGDVVALTWEMLLLITAFFFTLAIGGFFVGAKYHRPQIEIPIKQMQIANYIKGSALLLSIHITHHAGTSLCIMMKKLGPAPGRACNGPGSKIWRAKRDENYHWPANTTKNANLLPASWTSPMYVERFRPYFHFMSWEFGWFNFANLHQPNWEWEYDNLVSMIVMRDPMSRFLAGGKCGNIQQHLPNDPTNETQDLYWEYANSPCSDNYALKVLAYNSTCANGADTSLACLESAKRLLRKFTFILDQECLGDSMVALGAALHLNITYEAFESRFHHQHTSVRERMNNDTLYNFVWHRFRRDIELYEWSKSQSIVKC